MHFLWRNVPGKKAIATAFIFWPFPGRPTTMIWGAMFWHNVSIYTLYSSLCLS